MEARGTKDARKIRHVVERIQGETNGVFTLMTSEISIRTLRISTDSKTCDKSDC